VAGIPQVIERGGRVADEAGVGGGRTARHHPDQGHAPAAGTRFEALLQRCGATGLDDEVGPVAAGRLLDFPPPLRRGRIVDDHVSA
jgi:hypothetical protein